MKKMRNAKDHNACYTTTYQNVPDKKMLIAYSGRKEEEKREKAG
jgi:hypothetical protein